MFGVPPETVSHWANEVRVWGVFLAGLGVALSLAASYVQVSLQAEVAAAKEEAHKRLQLESQERIARLQADSAQAQADIVREREATAIAQERAAELSKEVEQVRLEQERLRARFSWRRISAEQRRQIADGLRAANLRPAVFVTTSDPEAAQFRSDVVAVLRDAGDPNPNWRSAAGSSSVVGLSVQGPKEQERSAVAGIFERAGFSMQNAGQAERLTIIIGAKPPPF
jgi:hypothetical protein